MAETEFFSAAFFAFISWVVSAGLAFWRHGQINSLLSKTLCWSVPVAGGILWVVVIWEGAFGESGGFSVIAFSLGAAIFYGLAMLYPVLQFILGFVAKWVDQAGS